WRMHVQLLRYTTILELTVEDWDPRMAARSALALAESFQERLGELKRGDSHSANQFLISRLEEVKKKLVVSERTLRTFEDENNSAHLEAQIKHLVEIRSLNLADEQAIAEKALNEEK